MIPLVRALRDALAAEGVTYCHWKSTTSLDRSCSGENDLDLLVRRSDAARLEAVLARLAFKEAVAARLLPGVVDYYGYDADDDRIVHAHIHYRLVIGDDLTKNYVLPLEDAFLTHVSAASSPLPVPPVELEYIVLVIRLIVKHSTWDALLLRRGRVTTAARAELDDLAGKVDRGRLAPTLAEHLPQVTMEVFQECERVLAAGSSVRSRGRAGGRLLDCLAGQARRSRTADVALKTVRLAAAYARRRPKRRRLARGGAIVAVVGADGAGKTTAVAALRQWLGRDFRTTELHLGKPPRSLTTRAVRLAVRAHNALRWLTRRPPRATTVPVAAFHAALARDRHRAYVRASRAALKGGVVVSDRFPLRQLSLMDGPKIAAEDAAAGGLIGRLARIERTFYELIGLPDVLVVLRVDPEIAVSRKPEEGAEFVRTRNREVWEADWKGTPARVVDAGRAPDEVLTSIKSLVWSEL